MNIDQIIEEISNVCLTSTKESTSLLKKAIEGGETNKDEIENWYNQRFRNNLIFIGMKDYARMCIDALKILGKTAPTDFGGSRQRDLAQLWADMTRGYLGEIALTLFLKEKFEIDAELAHEKGLLKDFLQTDLKKVKIDGKLKEPNLKIGIKTTKWNGIWFDIPGAQFNHSDINVLVKIGASREHLFTFLKEISAFKDKILKIGIEVGSLSEKEAEDLYTELPSFKPIPAYIAGFVARDEKYTERDYLGKMGRIHYVIHSWKGPIRPGDLENIKLENKVSGRVSFLGIGSFSHDSGYLFNTGNLSWKKEEWEDLLEKL